MPDSNLIRILSLSPRSLALANRFSPQRVDALYRLHPCSASGFSRPAVKGLIAPSKSMQLHRARLRMIAMRTILVHVAAKSRWHELCDGTFVGQSKQRKENMRTIARHVALILGLWLGLFFAAQAQAPATAQPPQAAPIAAPVAAAPDATTAAPAAAAPATMAPADPA